jgi:hypothetical protein
MLRSLIVDDNLEGRVALGEKTFQRLDQQSMSIEGGDEY